jgi:hypothetical protein
MGFFGQFGGFGGGAPSMQGGPENWLAFANQLKDLFSGKFNLGEHAQWSNRYDPDMAAQFRSQVEQWAQGHGQQQPGPAPGTPAVGPPSQSPTQPSQPGGGFSFSGMMQNAHRPSGNALADMRQQASGGNDLRGRLGASFF